MNKKIGLYLLLTTLILILFGIIMIYSSSSIWAEYKFSDSYKYVKHQTLFFLIGIISIIILGKINTYKILLYKCHKNIFNLHYTVGVSFNSWYR